MRNTACSPIPCILECCHPEEPNRPLVGEGWVAAGPLRGLFLQGHTHAWSEAHRGGSGTRRLYLLCLTSVTPHNTSCRTVTLWLKWLRESPKKLAQPRGGARVPLSASSNMERKKKRKNTWKLRGLHPTRRFSPVSSGSLWSLEVIMSGSSQ